MVIAVGDRLPDVTFTVMTEAGPGPNDSLGLFDEFVSEMAHA